MNRDDIIRMAKEAGYLAWHIDPRAERFAALVAAAEREACAKVCDETVAAWTQYPYNAGCFDCAKAIRARGES